MTSPCTRRRHHAVFGKPLTANSLPRLLTLQMLLLLSLLLQQTILIVSAFYITTTTTSRLMPTYRQYFHSTPHVVPSWSSSSSSLLLALRQSSNSSVIDTTDSTGIVDVFADDEDLSDTCLLVVADTADAINIDDASASTDPLFRDAEYHDISVFPHKPLGCTVEEALVVQNTLSLENSASTANGVTSFSSNKLQSKRKPHLFVSRVTDDGNAARAGVKVGDVLVGMSDIFGTVIDIQGYSLEQVKSLVMCRSEDEPLHIRVARNTGVVDAHEQALVELCSNPDMDNDGTEACIIDYIKGGYVTATNSDVTMKEAAVSSTSKQFNNKKADSVIVDDDDMDSDDILDSMYKLWSNEESEIGLASPLFSSSLSSSSSTDGTLQTADASVNNSYNSNSSNKKTVKPWSSRSSPSGTWVRDPMTGKLRNIDS